MIFLALKTDITDTTKRKRTHATSDSRSEHLFCLTTKQQNCFSFIRIISNFWQYKACTQIVTPKDSWRRSKCSGKILCCSKTIPQGKIKKKFMSCPEIMKYYGIMVQLVNQKENIVILRKQVWYSVACNYKTL